MGAHGAQQVLLTPNLPSLATGTVLPAEQAAREGREGTGKVVENLFIL